MKNWIQCYSGNWINLDHVSQVYVYKNEEKFVVVGNIAGQEAAFVISKDFENQQDAEQWLLDVAKVRFA